MNHPDDFERRQDVEATEEKEEHSISADPHEPEREASASPIDPQIFRESLKSGPQWFGVSYPNSTDPVYTDYSVDSSETKRRSEKRRRVCLIAACLAMVILVSALVGFGGAMLFNSMEPEEDPSHIDGVSDVNTPTPNVGEQIYPATGNEGYDYSRVVIEKNDGLTLSESTTGSAGDRVMSKIEAVAAAKDSVVEIVTTIKTNYSISEGAGSGVIIHADGIIVTNHHVIDGAQKVYVRLTNGNTYEATVRGSDSEGDIAILKIAPQETLTVARLGYSGALVEGEDVIAIGNPLGELGGTVTDGIISRVEREVLVDGVNMTLLQTNAAINSGNSGGGLFNMAGELIGIVNAKYSATGVEGLGFAIPIDTAIVSIEHLVSLGYIPDIPSIGITLMEDIIQTVTRPYYREVVGVYDAGTNTQFEDGDIILSIDGQAVSTISEVKQIVRSHRVGDTVTVVVQRDREEVTLQVTLIEYIP